MDTTTTDHITPCSRMRARDKISAIRKLPKHVREAQLKAGIKELDCLIARKQVSAD